MAPHLIFGIPATLIDILGYSAASDAFRLFARRMRSMGYSMIMEPHDEH
jgi:hypothetical protein